MATDYRDPIIQKIIDDVLEANGPSELSGHYINGDVLLPNKSELPLCYVTKDTVTNSPANNMETDDVQSLVAVIVYDFTQDYNDAYNIVAGSTGLMELCEARNDDYTLRSDSLLYLLQKNTQVANKFWIGVGTPVVINYGLGIERRGPGIFSVEATIRFNARLHLPSPI